MKCHIYIQARMGSTRLAGKVLKQVLGRPLLAYLIERLRRVQHADDIIILTTKKPEDDCIVAWAESEKVRTFRGEESDVLTRFYALAEVDKPDCIVRITADCPLIDPQIIDTVIQEFIKNKDSFDYVSNTLKRTFPRGMDVEVFSFDALKRAYLQAKSLSEREHVTLYMYRHPEEFRLHNFEAGVDLSQYRLTVDTKEDFLLISKLLEYVYVQNPRFSLQDIDKALVDHPKWREINAHIEQKPVL